MSADRFSLSEFTEFLDDTEGHRLAQFLQKKNGAVRPRCGRIFDREPERFSLDVRLKRLSSPHRPLLPSNEVIEEPENGDKITNSKTESDTDKYIKEEVVDKPLYIATDRRLESSQEKTLNAPFEICNNAQETVADLSCVCVVIPNSNGAQQSEETSTRIPNVMVSNRLSQSFCLSQSKSAAAKDVLSRIPDNAEHKEIHKEPTQHASTPHFTEPALSQCATDLGVQPIRTDDESQGHSAMSISISQPATPRSAMEQSSRSKITRSGGIGSADRLRRQVLKRLSNLGNNGRRTLLKEFESTLSSSDFAPQICSTPMHHIPPENLQKTPPQKRKTPNSTVQSNQNVVDMQIEEVPQIVVHKPASQQDQPFIRNVVDALEETIKKLKSIESSNIQTDVPHDTSQNDTIIQETPELLQQAQLYTTTSQRLNKSQSQATQELLQEVQKALSNIQKSQVQAPKIVIPVNQTFNQAPTPTPTPTTKETNCKETPTLCETQQRTLHAEEGQITDKTVHRNCSLVKCNATFTRSHASVLLPNTTPVIETTLAPSADSVHDQNVCGYKTRSRIFNCPTFLKHKTQTEKVAESPKEHTLNKCRSPMRPINQETRNTRATNQTMSPSVSLQQVNENRKSLSVSNKHNSALEDFQINSPQKSPTPNTSSVTRQNTVKETLSHQACGGRGSPAHISRRTTLNDKCSPAQTAASTTAAPSNDNEALAQLMTEDEDEEDNDYLMNKKRALRKSGPLNLAAVRQPRSLRSRRTNMRSLSNRRKTNAVPTSPLLSSDTETDSGPPPAHPLNLHHAQREQSKAYTQLKRPLNKPPNTPKNGEKFAGELKAHLARLTNLEILDLRKRNSMGKVLMAPTGLRKSTTSKNQILQEQLDIEEQIQLEILRRDLLGEADGLHAGEEEPNRLPVDEGEQQQNNDELVFTELLSAPDVFKDNVAQMQETIMQLTHRPTYNSSLLDDHSNERVSFRSPNSKSRKSLSRKNKTQVLPDITKRYIEIQQKIRKRRKRLSTSKRSLYTKGDSASEAELSKANVSSETEICPHNSIPIEPIPPPPTISPVHDFQIPSPPPPFVASTRFSLPSPPAPMSPMPMDEYLSPPASFLDNRSNESAAKMIDASITSRINSTKSAEAACQTVDDGAIFKKPTMPAPRVQGKIKKATNAKKARITERASNVTTTTDAQSSDEVEGVRRSKRGQVPRKQSYLYSVPNGRPFLEALHEEVRNRAHMRLERSKLSRLSAASASTDISVPVASSTVKKNKVKANSRRGGKPNANTQAHMFSYLGDTNTTSGTFASGGSMAETSKNSKANRLNPIEETPSESDDQFAAAENLRGTSDNVLPPATTGKRGAKKIQASKKKVKEKSKKKTKNAITEQQQNDAITENVNTVNKSMELATDSQVASDTGTVNRTGALEYSRVYLPPPPPLNKINEMFDQLKSAANNNDTSSPATRSADSTSPATTRQTSTRRVRVRLRRIQNRDNATSPTTSNASSSMSSSLASTSTQTAGGSTSNELLTWLKNITHLQSATDRSETYMDMRPSTAGRLFFTDLEGIDYAFYDTVEKSSLGYLRFKPLQSKPLKRTKKYHLHFVVLAGTFEIGTERELGKFGVGDMIAINIGCRYKITNLDNDIGILMVIKK